MEFLSFPLINLNWRLFELWPRDTNCSQTQYWNIWNLVYQICDVACLIVDICVSKFNSIPYHETLFIDLLALFFKKFKFEWFFLYFMVVSPLFFYKFTITYIFYHSAKCLIRTDNLYFANLGTEISLSFSKGDCFINLPKTSSHNNKIQWILLN